MALRGGGYKGAYEVGVLKAMNEKMDDKETKYDIIEGVSAGAIVAASIATYPIGNEKQAVDELHQLFRAYPANSIWENWPFIGPLAGLWKQSFFDDSKFK